VLKRVIVQNVASNRCGGAECGRPHRRRPWRPSAKGEVIFFAADKHNPVMATHRAQGQAVVYVEGKHLIASKGDMLQSHSAWQDVPITLGGSHRLPGRERHGQRGRGWSLGLGWDVIRKGLANFSNDSHNAAGRFNIFKYRGATVIADYGHNPDAMLALVQAVQALPAKPPLGSDQRRRRPA